MRAYIGLGANLGDRLSTLRAAVADIQARGLGQPIARSAVYQTQALLRAPTLGDQRRDAEYFNAALALDTEATPLELLHGLLSIEAAHGRRRQPGLLDEPRTLDLDILLLGDQGEQISTLAALTTPHPRLHERAFALLPLLDVAPTLTHPVLGTSLRALYQAVALPPLPRFVDWL